MIVSDDGIKPEALSRMTQANAALTKLNAIWREVADQRLTDVVLCHTNLSVRL